MNIQNFNDIKTQLIFERGISGHEEYVHCVVLALLIPIGNEYHFVFQKRHANIRQGGEICFPGGKVESSDASLLHCALRETKEEMGIPEENIEILGQLNTIVSTMGAIIDVFWGIAHVEPEKIVPHQSEVDCVFTLPLSFFLNNPPEVYHTKIQVLPSLIDPTTGEEIEILPSKQLGLPEQYHRPWGNYMPKVYVYHTDYGVLWGITARIVHDCVEMIHSAFK